MDQREDGLTVRDPEAERLEQKVGQIRSHLDGLVSELNHRRHVIGRRYGRPIGIAAAVAGVATIGALVYWRVTRKPPSRLQRLRGALDRMMAHPERVAAPPPPSVPKRLLAAALGAAVSIAVRRILA